LLRGKCRELKPFCRPPRARIEVFGNWYTRDEAQASQPHWITPFATATPRLDEEFRYDQSFQTQATTPTSIISTAARVSARLTF
jgi:hypothetical protein